MINESEDLPAAIAPGLPSMLPMDALTAGFDMPASGDARRAVQGTKMANTPGSFIGGTSRQGFRVGELCLMIRYEDASVLSEASAIHRLANAPDWFCGIANLQGRLTPVFDLARYIGVEPDKAAKRMLLVLAHGPDAAGMLVNGLPQRLRPSGAQDADAAASPPRLTPHLRGASLIDGQLWFDLDTRSLLDAIEQSLDAQS